MADEFKDLEVSTPTLSFGSDVPETKEEIVLTTGTEDKKLDLTEEMKQMIKMRAITEKQ